MIWRIANDLSGSVDGWDFKSYVLGALFYRFISENLAAYINHGEHEAGDSSFDYAAMSDEEAEFARAEVVAEKGFFILPSELFRNVRARAKQDENLNETLERVFQAHRGVCFGLRQRGRLKGLFDDLDVNSNKLGPTVGRRNDKLASCSTRSVTSRSAGSRTIRSIFGDAYEFLMQMYAANAGKSGGEYYTPQRSRAACPHSVLGKKQVNKVYDPAVGSGSLLLKFAKVLGKETFETGSMARRSTSRPTTLLASTCSCTTSTTQTSISRIGDTLSDPQHWDDEPFEAIVSNPPYSIKWDGDANPLLINDERFAPAGVLAPKSKADLAFTMHMLSWLAVNGTAAIVEFPGVLYRGGAEQRIRQYLVDNNYVDAVIQLPPDLFFAPQSQLVSSFLRSQSRPTTFCSSTLRKNSTASAIRIS